MDKRIQAADMLVVSDIMKGCKHISSYSIKHHKTLFQYLSIIVSRQELPALIPHWIQKHYRNHIFPAELSDGESLFHRANIDYIDAILIDMNPDVRSHVMHRGRYDPTQNQKWLHSFFYKKKI